MKKWMLMPLVAAFLLSAGRGLAYDRFQAGINFSMAFPQADFKDNIDRLGYGGSGYILYHLPESPFYVGVSAGLLIYGSERWSEPFSSTFPEVLVDARTQNYIFLAHLVFRIQPQGDFRPYVEGLFGLNYLWTVTSLHDAGSWGDEEFASAVNFSDSALSYGAGVGTQFTVLKALRRSGERAFSMDVEVGARYLTGGRAEYLKEGSIFRDNGDIYYDVLESATSLITARLGLCFRF